ncbi:TonB-dependent receptor [Luteibacter sp. PPL552]
MASVIGQGATRRIAGIGAFAALSVAIGSAIAQDVPMPGGATTLEGLDVTGKALSLQKAVAEKRALPVISDGISSDEIGSIPDFGLGEAVQRIPGVAMTINNGRGEAQFLNLRGLNPDYNTVTVDGVALPSTETTTRNVSLDVLPSSLAQQVSIYKSVTPDLPADAIGGITNLRTRSAFDVPDTFASARANLARWDNQRVVAGSTPSGQAEATLTHRFGSSKQFGVVLSTSYFRRDSSSLDTAMDSDGYYAYTGGTQRLSSLRQNAAGTGSTLRPSDAVDGMVAVPDRHRWLTYDNVRTRESVFGKMEWDNLDNARAHLTGGFFQHENDEQRRAQFLSRVGPATITSPTTGSFARGAAQADDDHYDQVRRIRYVDLGGSYEPSEYSRWDVTANYAVGSYRQTTREDVFTSAASSNLAFGYTAAPSDTALFTPVQPDYFMNPDNYTQTSYLSRDERSRLGTGTIRAEFTHNLGEDAMGWGYKAGVQSVNRQQHYDLDELGYVPLRPVSLGTIGIEDVTYRPYDGAGQSMLLVDPAKATAYFLAHPGNYALATTNARNSTLGDFDLNELTQSGYGVVGYRSDALSAMGGMRYEHTDQTVADATAQPANSLTQFVRQTQDQRYGKWLPSAVFSYALTPELMLRGGASKTLARASYAALAQNGTPTVSVAAGTISQTLANPSLRPRESSNYDLSLEWYASPDAMVSLAAFDKHIRHEIVSLSQTQSQMNPAGLTGTYLVTTTQAQNAAAARVRGLELSLVKLHFDALPGALRGLGATFNATVLDMNGPSIVMSDGSRRVLPMLTGAAKTLFNASLLYTAGPFNAQLSANRTGKMPISFATDNPVNDVYYGRTLTYDAQVRYAVDAHLSVLVQGKNLTNARPTRLIGPDQALVKEELDNGRAYFIGVNYLL